LDVDDVGDKEVEEEEEEEEEVEEEEAENNDCLTCLIGTWCEGSCCGGRSTLPTDVLGANDSPSRDEADRVVVRVRRLEDIWKACNPPKQIDKEISRICLITLRIPGLVPIHSSPSEERSS
jgi:hypothetical protein